MNLAGTTLALVLSVASMGPAFTGPALSQTDSTVTSGRISGQVESIDGSTVTVRTSDGSTQTYEIDPAAITSLRLSQGSTIQLGPNLASGEIIRVGPRNALVKLDNGETENFIVTREGRVTISPGDRVIITPDQRLTRVEDYTLRAGDVISVQPTAATTTSTDTTSTIRSSEVETGTTRTTEAPSAITTPPSTSQTEAAPVDTTPTTEAAPATTPTVEETQPPVRALW